MLLSRKSHFPLKIPMKCHEEYAASFSKGIIELEMIPLTHPHLFPKLTPSTFLEFQRWLPHVDIFTGQKFTKEISTYKAVATFSNLENFYLIHFVSF